MRQFVTGSNVSPFYKASQATIELLESASAATLALAVPFIKITQVDPYTGEKVPDVSFSMDITSPPGFGRPTRNGSFLERPLVSLDSITNKYQPQNAGVTCYSMITLNFTVHDPYTVFFDDNTYSSFRAILQEGHSFLLEYGWRGNCDNELLNGLGFHDEATGFTIPAIKRSRINVTTWKANLSTNGEMKLTVDSMEDGEISFREAKLIKHLDLAGLEGKRVKQRKSPRASLPDADGEVDIGITKSVVSALKTLKTISLKPHGEAYKFVDILNEFVAPILEKTAQTAGYADVELFLGNFSTRCSRSAKSLGSRELAGKSIGDVYVSVKEFKKALGTLHANGETTATVDSFIGTLISMVNNAGMWQDDRPNHQQPELFRGTSSAHTKDGKLNFVMFIADRKFSSVSDDDFIRDDKPNASEQTREATLKRIRARGVPIIQFGKAGSIIKDCSFSSQINDLTRANFVEKKFMHRKSQVQKTSNSDVQGRQGNSSKTDYAFFSGIQAEITLIGNFIMNMAQTVWLDIMSVDPMSGFYTVYGIQDEVTSSGFVTKITVGTTGADPVNVRGKGLTRREQEQQKLDEELERKKQAKKRSGSQSGQSVTTKK